MTISLRLYRVHFEDGDPLPRLQPVVSKAEFDGPAGVNWSSLERRSADDTTRPARWIDPYPPGTPSAS